MTFPQIRHRRLAGSKGFLDPGLLLPGSAETPAASPLLLDAYPGAVAAYSLRKLRTAYSGAAIRVRRSSDNAEADIGFDSNGDLDTAALLAHCGAGNGFTPTAYDHGGGGKDGTNAVSTEQHQVVVSGSVGTINGIPCFLGSGNNNQHLTGIPLTSGEEYYAVAVLETTDTHFGFGPTRLAHTYLAAMVDGSILTSLFAGASGVSYRKNGTPISPSTRDDLHTEFATGVPVLFGVTFTADGSGTQDYAFGYDAAEPYSTDTKMSDFIVWPTSGGLDKDGIDAAIMSDYGIS